MKKKSLVGEVSEMKQVLLALIPAVLLGGCTESMHDMHSNSFGAFENREFQSTGEQIYFTGRSGSGEPITLVGGHHHMRMHGGGCVTCHGENREGGARMWPWFWEVAPAITLSALQGEHDDHGHAHDEYNADALKRAIRDGIDPEGDELDDLMPRWKMSEPDLDALVQYLLSDGQPGT